MIFHDIARFIKSLSYMILTAQGRFLQNRLVKKLGYDPKKNMEGGSVEISQKFKDDLQKMEDEIRAILKTCKNNPEAVVKYFEETLHVNVYKVKDAKKHLKKMKEEIGFITERNGLRALKLNRLIKQGFKFHTELMIITEEEPDIYVLVNAMHKWFAKRMEFPGFEEKYQRLVKASTSKNLDKVMSRLSLPDMRGFREAMKRDIQAIDFLEQYVRENQGSKKALEELKSDKGASI